MSKLTSTVSKFITKLVFYTTKAEEKNGKVPTCGKKYYTYLARPTPLCYCAVDLFSCLAASVFNKLTLTLTLIGTNTVRDLYLSALDCRNSL